MRDTIGQHARLVKRRVAEGLTVHTELELFEAHFAPKDTAAVPAHFAAGLENIGSIAGATCFGTGGQAMMRRARERAEYALLLLRNGLCSHRGLNEQQPRVRLGDVSWFTDDVGGGWDQRPDAIFHVTLTDELVEQATSTAAATPPPENGTKLERAAKRALYWCSRRSSPCSSSSA